MTHRAAKPSETREPAPARPPSHYQTLGVTDRATPEQIRSAYRRAAKRVHPDVSAGADAQARFAELAAAYEVLADPMRRRAYDAQLREESMREAGSSEAHYTWTGVGGSGVAPMEPTDLDEMYETFFKPHRPAE